MSVNHRLVCIKKPEPCLSAIFEDMYLNERLVDVTLSCIDGHLQAHRLVLAAGSSYFSNLFDKLSNPFHYPVVVIKDMRIDDLRLILDFMYRGRLTIREDKLASLVKSAENLQIHGLSEYVIGDASVCSITNSISQRNKRPKKVNSSAIAINNSSPSSSLKLDYQHQNIFSHPEKLLEQSMTINGESITDGHHFSYSNNDPTSTRNLNSQAITDHSPTSVVNVQHLSSIDAQHHQLQVLSNSSTANRTSMSTLSIASGSNHSGGELQTIQQQTTRPRGVHPCNICWKTFREKANLKRHLQVHSIDRVIYACPDCNKTFSWKDNYIRHTKAAHQKRQQA